jgi:ribosomal protein S10
MKTFDVIIKSKNQNSIAKLFSVLKKKKCNNIKKYFQKKTKRKRITILKSPHVHKSAQEQFETIIYNKQLSLYAIKNLTYLTFLKKLNFNLFPDINLKLKYRINSNNLKKIKVKIFNPNNFKFQKYKNDQIFNLDLYKIKLFIKNKRKTYIKKTNSVLNLFDFYGEFLKVYV